MCNCHMTTRGMHYIIKKAILIIKSYIFINIFFLIDDDDIRDHV